QIEYSPLDALKPNPKNPRRRPKKQLHKICASYNAHGVINPIIVDENNVILAGHARYEAALMLSLQQMPVIRITDLSEEQKLSYMLADNQLGTYSDWDLDSLYQILNHLDAIDYPVEFTGFETAQVDNLLIADAAHKNDILPELPMDYVPITKRGDVWR